MKKAYWKDILRTILKSKKRFMSILIITVLGVTVLTGIYAACEDMYRSADRFYEQQNLFDIQILSTLGLTDEDVYTLQQIDVIEEVTGTYRESVKTEVEGIEKDADVSVLSGSSVNEPYLQEGRLPLDSGEIAVTKEYLDDTGKSIGDEVTIYEDIDSLGEEDSTDMGVTASDFDIDIEIKVEEETPTFSKTTFTITGVVLDPMDIRNSSTSFRTSNSAEYIFFILSDDADYAVFTSIYITLAGLNDTNCFSDEYEASVQDVIGLIEDTIKNQREQTRYDKVLRDALEPITEAEAAMNKSFADAEQEIADAWADIEKAKQEIQSSETEITKAEENGLQLTEERAGIENGKAQLNAAEIELTQKEEEYRKAKEEAEQNLADAYAELDKIDMPVWYVQDRTVLDSYANLQSDMSSIETVGNAFPVIFLIVAILISLTTMTRMVEEERGLIGAYKALGFNDGAIYLKYLFYAFFACIFGGLLGDIFGFIVLPKILISILRALYAIPDIYLSFDMQYGVGGVLLFLVSVVASTAIACRNELVQTPATLMRPKAPRAGSRIALEHFPFIWNNLSFLNKVTARNLFRYKKRMFMTVLGITGCTALVLCGFAIKDSVFDLPEKQYNQIYRYDLMAVSAPDHNEAFLDYISDESRIGDYINLQIDQIKLISADRGSESATLMVIPRDKSIENYINVKDTDGNDIEQLVNDGIYVTQNAAELLLLKTDSVVTLQNTELERQEVRVAQVVRNYLGNNVYMTQELYETLFGDYEPNGVLASLTLDAEDQGNYAERLLEYDFVVSSVSIEASYADFASNFTLLNAVVYILILLAAGLAFAVLFTLSNTNISERNRELATTKVLGFFDREVHSYVNKETIILTLIGILIGLPVGRFISGLLTSALKMPSLYFAVYISPSSYLISAIISLSFALIVNLMTNRSLDRIDMVEALKSVE